MRIVYLKLENFAGIYAGMQKRKIEIDFNKDVEGNDISNNNIIMLFGGNGSGKSTILSTLHPFMDTGNDERKNPIMDDKEGYKEIHYYLDHMYYVIRHYYKKQNKCYIKELGEQEYILYRETMKEDDETLLDDIGIELNENGGVRSFKEVVEDKLDVNEEFFKLSRIGSNVTNFIDLSTAKRKEFISMFLPDIQEYLDAYNKVNEKHRDLKKNIAYISDEMQKLDSKDNLEIDIKSTINNIKDIEELMSSNVSNKSKYLTKIEIINKDGQYDNGNPYSKELKEKGDILLKDVSVVKELKDTVKEYFDPDKDMVSILEKEITSLEYDLKTNNDAVTRYKININDLFPEIKKKKELIENNSDDSSKVEKNYKIVKQEKEDIEALLKACNNDLIDYNNTDMKTCANMEFVGRDLIESIKNLNLNLDDNSFELLKKLNEKDNVNSIYLKGICNRYSIIEDENKNKLTELNTELEFHKNNLGQLDILRKRPDECSIDSCPFIKNALQFKNVEDDIKNTQYDIEEINKILPKIKEEKEIYENLYRLINNIENIFNSNYQEYLSKIKTFEDIDNFNSFISQYINMPYKEFLDKFKISGITEYKQYLELEEANNEKLERLNILREEYKKNKKMIDNIKEELDNLVKKRNTYTSNIEEHLEIINNIENSINSKKVIRDNLNKFNESFNNYNSLKETVLELKNNSEAAEKDISEINSYKTEISILDREQEKQNKILEEFKSKYEKVSYNLKRLNEYEERKSKLEEKYEELIIFKDALDPKKGIPIFFIDNYLNKTREITNNLLDISQKGKFAIDFDIDSKNFFIRIYKSNGDILEDITIASQGETSITSLSLSLALIEQSLSKHNILYLDELDGALDDENRKGFIEMVEAQMSKLGIEQVFIISHNKEFDYYPLDLILLKDAQLDIDNEELMSNKNIIFKY